MPEPDTDEAERIVQEQIDRQKREDQQGDNIQGLGSSEGDRILREARRRASSSGDNRNITG